MTKKNLRLPEVGGGAGSYLAPRPPHIDPTVVSIASPSCPAVLYGFTTLPLFALGLSVSLSVFNPIGYLLLPLDVYSFVL
jgi:hypothetical protein